jgi:hypothetical protein
MLASNARSCIRSPVYLTLKVMASSFADVEGLQDARYSHIRFARALAFFPSGEYSFDRLVLIKWRFPDLLVFLQLHDTDLSFSCRDSLISRSFLLLTLLDILSFDRAVHHSVPLHFFLTLAVNAFHLLL